MATAYDPTRYRRVIERIEATFPAEPDYARVAVEADKLADRYSHLASDRTPLQRAAMGTDQLIRDWRHIAADARSAGDGCEASARSVLDWLAEDEILSRACCLEA